MKVLFLDIDGVLNSYPMIYDYGSDFISNRLVKYLKHIIHNTKANIVLSSTWRLLKSRQIVVYELNREGMEIFSDTPELKYPYGRMDEINLWLSLNKVDNFIILDDLELNSDRLVKTDPDIGLTLDLADYAIRLLT